MKFNTREINTFKIVSFSQLYSTISSQPRIKTRRIKTEAVGTDVLRMDGWRLVFRFAKGFCMISVDQLMGLKINCLLVFNDHLKRKQSIKLVQ